MISFRIFAQATTAENGLPLEGLFVKAYDKDLVFDDLLGSAISDYNGRITIVCEQSDFRDFFELRPDIYFKIFKADQTTLLHTTKHAVRWNAGKNESFVISIPQHELVGTYGEPHLQLSGEQNNQQKPRVPEVGDSLTLSATGLVPGAAHEIDVISEDRLLFTSRLMADRHGVLESTVLWPQFGMDDPNTDRVFSVEEAKKRWSNRALTVRIRFGQEILAEQTVTIGEFTRPFILNTDDEGRMLNGFEIGKHSVRVEGYNISHQGDVRIYMVPRQHDWAPGNPFQPVTLASGRAAFTDIRVGAHGSFSATVASADELIPGAYDFIVRPLRYGYEDDEDFILRPTDVFTRRVTGVVVRMDFMDSKVGRGGCVNMLPISGRTLSGTPYFQYADSFQEGENIYGAIDPGAIAPAQLGKMVATYVIQSKSAATWNIDSSLTHLPVLGGNPNVLKVKTQVGCVNYNIHLLWANAQLGSYDIVLDFGNNTSDPLAFVPDNNYDTMPVNDIVDGYMAPGFRVVKDPAILLDYPQIGAFQYDEATEGSLNVGADDGQNWGNIALRATVRFPADIAGATLPGQISGAQPNYPIAVMVHGNGHSYLGYDYLIAHWAHNGFIAASIHLQDNMHATGRLKLLAQHLTILKNKFGATAADNIGIVGHSRGGEAVSFAPKFFHNNLVPHTLNAVMPLAPTNQYHQNENDLNVLPYSKPLFVMYGSMDGDVNGSYWANILPFTLENSGFAHYDKANGSAKTMAFIYGATHDRFTTIGTETDVAWLGATDVPKLINADAHEATLKAYSNAFFRRFLRGEIEWDEMLRGEWIPSTVTTVDAGKVKLFIQHQDVPANCLVIDNFEGIHNANSWQTSTINDSVTDAGTLVPIPVEDELYDVDVASPHDSSGLLLRWDNNSDKLEFSIPAGQRNVTTFEALSFRITQKRGSIHNPINTDQDLYVELSDGTGNSRSIRASKFDRIPFPHERENLIFDPTIVLTKSAMNTVRIPLHAYTIECAGLVKINLNDVTKVSFRFLANAAGEVEVDDVQFTK